MQLIIGTRHSPLARWQTNHVIAELQKKIPQLQCVVHTFTTEGDRTLDRPLPQIGGKGLFTAELEQALHAGEIDIAVHSLKDLPVQPPDGLMIGAVMKREDPRDLLIARPNDTLMTLPHGSRVGTSSLRRAAQLLIHRPDLNILSIRGNVETRLRKLAEGQYEAIILAAAGLLRLGLTDTITQWFTVEEMVPAPGQGALAVQCRADDAKTVALLELLNDPESHACTTAERTFLHQLGGGCSTPVGGYATMDGKQIDLHGFIGTPDGLHFLRLHARGDDPIELGRQMAQSALAQGAGRLLNPPRVVITRSDDQSDSFAQQLKAIGCRPILFPAIEIIPFEHPDQANIIEQLGDFSQIIFTSVNAVKQFWQRLADYQVFLPSTMMIAAIGLATAEQLTLYGHPPDIMPAEFVGEQLVEALGDVSGKAILLPRAKVGRPEIVSLLRQRGAVLTELPLYETVRAIPTPEQIAQLKAGFEMITFTSPSSVRNFCLLAEEYGLSLMGKKIASIGPITTAELKKYTLFPDIIPTQYTIPALVNAIRNSYE